MAEAHKYADREGLLEVYPDIALRTNFDTGVVEVWDEKEGDYVTVEKGQHVVKIGDRYEVQEKQPEKAKKAEPKESDDSAETPKAVKGNQTVVPEELASAPGPDSK